MIIDKYQVFELIEKWLGSDEECSGSCVNCRYGNLCEGMDSKGDGSTLRRQLDRLVFDK